jgi:primosomal protein N' (replication factor Y)
MTKPLSIIHVALPSPFRRLFDYTHPESISPGVRVSVPFGHQKAIVGIVIESSDHSLTPTDKLRGIHSILDEKPVIDSELLTLCKWCADYYHYPLGEICHIALPALLRKTEPLPKTTLTLWRITDTGKDATAAEFSRAPKQGEAMAVLQARQQLTNEEAKQLQLSPTILKTLEKKSLIEKRTIDKSLLDNNQQASDTGSSKRASEYKLLESPKQLNDEQRQAVGAIQLNTFNTYLLDGVTGSGKTEVYLQLIEQVLSKGQQVLVLVPEIGLTPQTVSRFEKRFKAKTSTLHSKLTDRERLQRWQSAKLGNSDIIIGTRSSIFTPLPNLGLIVVDEEHDLSFKQQEGVRYSARDIAIVRAQRRNIPLILGSATPSLESLLNAQQGRYQHLILHRRANELKLPAFSTVDTNSAALHDTCIAEINKTLDNQQQALVFINRRGYAPTLICQDCGWISLCSQCDCRMTLHRIGKPQLHCHHCDTRTPVPNHCPHCQSTQLQALGTGTQRSEEQLERLFPNIPVLRLDRDKVSRKGEWESALEQINSGEPCLIVGTQMLAKGHHFANLGLVVIIGLDQSFFSSDFRGAERMGQLLTQVAGRAGREKQSGKVLVQTQFADHPHLKLLLENGYPDFANALVSERKLTAMPPFEYLALIRCHAQQANLASEFLHKVREIATSILPPDNDLHYLGPFPAAMEKRNNRYHFLLQIKSNHRGKRKFLLQKLCEQLETLRPPKGVHWLVDVDPYEF